MGLWLFRAATWIVSNHQPMGKECDAMAWADMFMGYNWYCPCPANMLSGLAFSWDWGYPIFRQTSRLSLLNLRPRLERWDLRGMFPVGNPIINLPWLGMVEIPWTFCILMVYGIGFTTSFCFHCEDAPMYPSRYQRGSTWHHYIGASSQWKQNDMHY